ncbi:hypothetical protein KFU94_41570 [Chloroflexi bacterium TSY]|nr:hypothetical protein [Chloroflexi bacterium TSY]
MLTTTDLRWAQATTPPTLAGQLGPASYSTRPLTPLSLLLLPFFSGQTDEEHLTLFHKTSLYNYQFHSSAESLQVMTIIG